MNRPLDPEANREAVWEAVASLPEPPPPTAVHRLLQAVPWPLAVIPPFIAALALPILALAVIFSVVASTTHVVQSTIRLSGRVEVYGMRSLTADRTAVDFGELDQGDQAEATIYVTNGNDTPAYVVVTATGIPPGCALYDFPRDAVLVRPGQTEQLHIGVVREAEAEGGDYQFRLILLASPER